MYKRSSLVCVPLLITTGKCFPLEVVMPAYKRVSKKAKQGKVSPLETQDILQRANSLMQYLDTNYSSLTAGELAAVLSTVLANLAVYNWWEEDALFTLIRGGLQYYRKVAQVLAADDSGTPPLT